MDAFLSTRRGFWTAVVVMLLLAALLIPIVTAALDGLVNPTPTSYCIERNIRGDVVKVTMPC